MDNIGEYNRIKHQLEEYGTLVSNPIYKLLGNSLLLLKLSKITCTCGCHFLLMKKL